MRSDRLRSMRIVKYDKPVIIGFEPRPDLRFSLWQVNIFGIYESQTHGEFSVVFLQGCKIDSTYPPDNRIARTVRFGVLCRDL